RILDKDLNIVLSGFALPDTATFNVKNLISNTESVILRNITGSSIHFEQSYLIPTKRLDVPWDEEVTNEHWYIDYIEHPTEMSFSKNDISDVSYEIEGRTLALTVHVTGWIKPTYVNNKPNIQYFEQEIHKEIRVDLDSKKIIKMKNLNE